jgi:predicted Zn finger-like uncharacterized protein
MGGKIEDEDEEEGTGIMSDMTFQCPACSTNLTVDEEAAGVTVPCPACGKPLVVPPPVLPAIPVDPAPPPREAPPARAAPAAPTHSLANRHISAPRTQYKVVALGDKNQFPGRFDATAIEHKLNELAQSGWTFVSITRVHWPNSFGTVQEEMLLFFEKPAEGH